LHMPGGKLFATVPRFLTNDSLELTYLNDSLLPNLFSLYDYAVCEWICANLPHLD